MFNNIYLNSQYLLNLKPRIWLKAQLILWILVMSVFILLRIECYDSFKKIGYISCYDSCKLEIQTNVEEVSTYKEMEIIEVKNTKKEVDKVEVSDILVDDKQALNYYIVTYYFEKIDNLENLFYQVKLYTNKSPLYQKIFNILFR